MPVKQKITAWEPHDFFFVGTDCCAIVKIRQVKDEFASCFGHLPYVLRNLAFHSQLIGQITYLVLYSSVGITWYVHLLVL
jgi:hypothetical protein